VPAGETRKGGERRRVRGDPGAESPRGKRGGEGGGGGEPEGGRKN